MSDIGERYRELERARREAMKTLMAEYDVKHNAALKALREECATVGHHWQFTHLGPLGHPWFHCTICNASKVQLDES